MSNFKKIIEQDIDQIIPIQFHENMRDRVMKSIDTPKKSFRVSFAEKKDNIILFFTLIFCILLIYFFGYSEKYKISIFVPKELIYNFLLYSSSTVVILIFLINDYFDRKKKILI
ncbi:MAG: hypothetical protein JNL75_06295 [Chitinophagales bacterium]|nr:hypothetical protein [Chitinophagales bacterium]